MNVYLISVILGIVEGLTEFLPVSSTAHLRIAEALLKLPMSETGCALNASGDCLHAVAYWKMYTIVIQGGAILALLLLYLARILEFLRTFPRGDRGDRNFITHPLSLTIWAFACTSVLALAFKKWSDHNLGSILAMAIALVAGGVIMWVVDARSTRYEPNTVHVEEMSLGQSIWIGICQSLAAIFPGVSRSMSTIAAGQLVSMDRPTALEFSFLLSIPTMLAATGYDLWKEVLHHGRAVAVSGAAGDAAAMTTTPAAHVVMNIQNWIVLVIGFVVSFIVAYGVVEWFLAWVRKHGFTIFAIYRILLGIALLIWGAKIVAG
ncbi:MAG TPA: undecaprenyl-diphosphate phosphatase [Terracidiphilus sp.]|nr:undecaprenyl-diphosphate phosphatase [Terracidiphilus sp.]